MRAIVHDGTSTREVDIPSPPGAVLVLSCWRGAPMKAGYRQHAIDPRVGEWVHEYYLRRPVVGHEAPEYDFVERRIDQSSHGKPPAVPGLWGGRRGPREA